MNDASTVHHLAFYEKIIMVVLLLHRLFAAGAHRALNGTCNILDDPRDETAICPAIDITVQPQCTPTGQRGGGNVPHHLQWYIMGATVALCLLLN